MNAAMHRQVRRLNQKLFNGVPVLGTNAVRFTFDTSLVASQRASVKLIVPAAAPNAPSVTVVTSAPVVIVSSTPTVIVNSFV